ncbi:hypothetical protein ACIBUR_07815 [Streptomyces anulatus]
MAKGIVLSHAIDLSVDSGIHRSSRSVRVGGMPVIGERPMHCISGRQVGEPVTGRFRPSVVKVLINPRVRQRDLIR